MTFRHFAPALALSFLMISCAAEMTPQQKAQIEQQRRAEAAKKRAQAEKKAKVRAEAERKKRKKKAEAAREKRELDARFDQIIKEMKRLIQAGKAAEKNGKLRKAFDFYNKLLKQQFAWFKLFGLEKLSEEKRFKMTDRTRRSILRVAAKLDPPPAIPFAVERHSIRASTFLKTARSKEDFNRVIGEYIKALKIAPWWADGYFNLALVFEKAERIDLAILNVKLYLTVKPNAPDTKAFRQKLIALEAMNEQLAPYKAWLGKWGGKGQLAMKLDGDTLSLVFVKPGDYFSGLGYRIGDKYISGKLDGKTLRGTYFSRFGRKYPAQVINCFGRMRKIQMAATLSKNGRKIIMKYRSIATFNTKTCQITKTKSYTHPIGKYSR